MTAPGGALTWVAPAGSARLLCGPQPASLRGAPESSAWMLPLTAAVAVAPAALTVSAPQGDTKLPLRRGAGGSSDAIPTSPIATAARLRATAAAGRGVVASTVIRSARVRTVRPSRTSPPAPTGASSLKPPSPDTRTRVGNW